jgi:DNA helicase-2/ATP-dependent DNA helicase PcrA
VLSAKGDGHTCYSTVTDVFRRSVLNRTIIKVRTARGYEIATTPEHVHFARYMLNGEELFFTYLMYKRNVGYRIGVTRRYRFEGQNKPSLGFIQRTNQERADAVWLLEASKSEQDARYWEQYYAATFNLPTCVFMSAPGAKMPQSSIDRLFASIDTEAREKITRIEEHVTCASASRTEMHDDKRRRNFGVTLCKDGRRNTLHYCEVLGSDPADAAQLRAFGLQPTASKRSGWRIRTVTQDFAKIMDLHKTVTQALGEVNLLLKAGFSNGLSFHFTPASHVLPGMMMYVQTENGIESDQVEAVERKSTRAAFTT